MRPRGRWAATASMAAALVLSACGEPPSSEHVIVEQVTVEHPEGLDVARLTLTAKAAERLDIQTTPVEEAGDRTVVPSAAVIVDPEGLFWVYTSPEALVFLRRQIGIGDEEGGRTFLSAGPPAGTTVVTVGVAELYGAESGIGH